MSVPRRRLDLRVEEVRDLRRANKTPTQIVRWLLHRAGRAAPDSPTQRAEPTTIAVMWAMHQVFELSLENLAEIGPWRAAGFPMTTLMRPSARAWT